MNDHSIKTQGENSVPFWDAVPYLDIEAVLAAPPPRLDFVIPGLKSGTVGALVSAGGTGKSALTLQLAAAVACGIDTLQLKSGEWSPRIGRVVFLTAEDPPDVLAKRIHALRDRIVRHEGGNAALRTLAQNLEIRPLIGLLPNLMDESQTRDGLMPYLRGARLIIIDTLRRFHQLDENNGGDMARLLAQIEMICNQAAPGEDVPAVLFLHHTNKNSARDGGASEQQAARGSSVLTDNARLQMNLSTMTISEARDMNVDEDCRKSFVRLCFAKTNYSAPMQDLWYRRDADTGGMLEPAVFDLSQARQGRGGRQREEA